MTATRTAGGIRADLRQAREDLEGLSDGTLTWDMYAPELRNGALQDLAVEMAAERVADLERELKHAEMEAGER